MRIRHIELFACILAALALSVTGCAQKRTNARTVPPTHEQLPSIEEKANPYPVSVGVPRAPNEPRVIFVPKFEPIELTAEEKKKLGIHDDPIDFLEFYRPEPSDEGRLTLPWNIRALTAIDGVGGGSAAVMGPSSRSIAAYDYPGVFGYGEAGTPRASSAPGDRSVWILGERAPKIVGYNESSHRASHFRQIDP